MKNIPTAVQNILNGSHFWMADCYTITLASGFVARYTSADFDLTDVVTGHKFIGTSGPTFSRSRITQKVGLEVDELTVTVNATINDQINGTPFISAIRTGQLDYATIQLDRSYRSGATDTSAGLVTVFSGLYAGATEVSSVSATFTAKSHIDLLNQNMPRDVYQTGCRYTLFDVNCTLSKSAFSVSPVTVNAGSNVNTVLVAYSGQPGGYFALGTITFLTGALAGQEFSIKGSSLSGSQTILSTIIPLPQAPAAGDTATITAGCNKTQNICSSKFSNLANFGGQPYIPIPETAA